MTDRRKRNKKPLSLIILSIILFLAPLVNIINLARIHGIPLNQLSTVFEKLKIIELIFIVSPILDWCGNFENYQIRMVLFSSLWNIADQLEYLPARFEFQLLQYSNFLTNYNRDSSGNLYNQKRCSCTLFRYVSKGVEGAEKIPD